MTKLLIRGLEVLVDDEDVAFVTQHKWYVAKRNYLFRYIGHSSNFKYLHHELLGATRHSHVDHINHNTLDNQRANLRICSISQNAMNRNKRPNTSSRFKGVSFYKRYKKWKARVKIDETEIWLGYFNDEINAAKAYNEAAKKYFGEFAQLNNI